ncbi:MAG: hypothetical protein E7570_00695 [Ruminococcaceae bacterium]|nr:hypothetical protein [Oscillospiraceae bacterium]
MLCSSCGKALDFDAKFCDKCGMPVAEAFAVPSESKIADNSATAASVQTKQPVIKTNYQRNAAVHMPASVQRKPAVNNSGVRCSKCGAILPTGSNFCDLCGAPARQINSANNAVRSNFICKNCGAALIQGSRFCGKCGATTLNQQYRR